MMRGAKLGAFALAVLILLSLATPVLAETNFAFVSENVLPRGDLIVEGKVSAELVLKEISPSLSGHITKLKLETGLVDPIWNIITTDDAETKTETITETRSSFYFDFDHTDFDTITIKLDGTSPSVDVRTSVVVIEVKQVITPEISDVYTIKRDVTSEKISDALDAIYRAQDKITEAEGIVADAKDAGADVTNAEEYLQTAKIYYKNSNDFYIRGAMNESIAAANNAYDNAVKACNSATGASGHHVLTSRVIYVAVIIAILIIAVVVYQKRRWERL